MAKNPLGKSYQALLKQVKEKVKASLADNPEIVQQAVGQIPWDPDASVPEELELELTQKEKMVMDTTTGN